MKPSAPVSVLDQKPCVRFKRAWRVQHTYDRVLSRPETMERHQSAPLFADLPRAGSHVALVEARDSASGPACGARPRSSTHMTFIYTQSGLSKVEHVRHLGNLPPCGLHCDTERMGKIWPRLFCDTSALRLRNHKDTFYLRFLKYLCVVCSAARSAKPFLRLRQYLLTLARK